MSDSSSSSSSPNDDLMDDYFDGDATVVGSPTSITPAEYPRGLTSRELAHALKGEMLDHFLLQQFIGGGGMGVVFKALDTTLDRVVAVKVVASHRVDSEDLQRRFLIEAQSTARLDHPNIARIHYIGRDRGLPYIVFEYIDGVNIRDLVMEHGPLAPAEAVAYTYQIAHALAHAWNRDVVHRDIKPSNILVSRDGQAKLVDMGLARLRQMDAEEEELTATGITLGTFDYISPEQARDPRVADCRSDIYSLGCTVFYMLTGQAPFAHGTAVQKLLQHQGEKPPDLHDFRSDIPESLVALVQRMLAKQPGDRPQTPVEVVQETTAILNELGIQLPHALVSMPLLVPGRPVSRVRRHAVWAVPAAALLAAGLWFDRAHRGDATASPFAPLEVPPAEQVSSAPPESASIVSPALPAASTAASGATSQAVANATNASPGASDPAGSLAIGREWSSGVPMWDLFSKWPAPPASVPKEGSAFDPPLMAPASPQAGTVDDFGIEGNPEAVAPSVAPSPAPPVSRTARPGPPAPREPVE